MSVPFAYVKGTFRDGTGTPRAGQVVTFYPQSTPFAVDGDVFTSHAIVATLNGSGYLAPLKLVKGIWRVNVTDIDNFFISVPDDEAEHEVDVLAGDLAGSGATLRRVLSAKEVAEATQDGASIRRTRRGDPHDYLSRIAFFGESGDLSADTVLVEFMTQNLVGNVVILGNANPGGLNATLGTTVGTPYASWYSGYTDTHPIGATAGERLWYACGDIDNNVVGLGSTIGYFSYADTLNSGKAYYKKALRDLVVTDVDLFVIDSNQDQADGYTAASTQGLWLQAQLAASTARWKIVCFRNTPFVSVNSKSSAWMDWPFASWGAHAVVAAGAKVSERLDLGGIPLFVTGAAGTTTLDTFGTTQATSQFRFNAARAVLYVDASDYELMFNFVNLSTGAVLDRCYLRGREDQKTTHALRFDAWSGLTVGQNSATYEPQYVEVDELAVGAKLWVNAPILQSILTPIRGGVIRKETLPTVTEAKQDPALRASIIIVGNDPARPYYWDAAYQTFRPLMADTYSASSYYGGSLVKLSNPTLTPGGGYTQGIFVDHADSTVQIWISVDGGLFLQMSNWPTQKQYPITLKPSRPTLVAAYAFKTGYIASDIVYGQYAQELDTGTQLG